MLGQKPLYKFLVLGIISVSVFVLLPSVIKAQTSTDTTPPVISSVRSVSISGGVAIQWDTNEPADSRLAVYTAASCPAPNCMPPVIKEVSSLTVAHTMVVMNLIPGTTYTYIVLSADAQGNEARYDNRTFSYSSISPTPTPITYPTPTPGIDITAPYISSITSTAITPFTATINWATNEPADSQVEFCPTYTTCGNNTPIVSDLTLQHTINLSGLTPSTYYYYWVKSKDAAGNLRINYYRTFKTTSGATTSPTPTPIVSASPAPTSTDITAPYISYVTITNVTQFVATVNWTTNEPADGQIAFCTTYLVGCANNTPLVNQLTTQHTINLSGLTPSTYYYMWIKSRDAAGNLRTYYRSFKTAI